MCLLLSTMESSGKAKAESDLRAMESWLWGPQRLRGSRQALTSVGTRTVEEALDWVQDPVTGQSGSEGQTST